MRWGGWTCLTPDGLIHRWKEDSDDEEEQEQAKPQQKAKGKRVPPQGKRKGWIPRTVEPPHLSSFNPPPLPCTIEDSAPV